MNRRQSIVDQTQTEVARRMEGQGAGHDMDHVLRVLRTARELQKTAGGNLFIIELAALLHDIGDAKFHHGVERSGEFATEILNSLAVDSPTVEHVVHIVENLSFRKRETADPLSAEGRIVQDADRLDALGAVGIVRTIEYGACKGQPFFAPDRNDIKTGVQHFYDKLFRLRELMNTQAGRRLALEREVFMRDFLKQFYLECGQTNGIDRVGGF